MVGGSGRYGDTVGQVNPVPMTDQSRHFDSLLSSFIAEVRESEIISDRFQAKGSALMNYKNDTLEKDRSDIGLMANGLLGAFESVLGEIRRINIKNKNILDHMDTLI